MHGLLGVSCIKIKDYGEKTYFRINNPNFCILTSGHKRGKRRKPKVLLIAKNCPKNNFQKYMADRAGLARFAPIFVTGAQSFFAVASIAIFLVWLQTDYQGAGHSYILKQKIKVSQGV
ncbi:MAG: hypothetical protein ACK529_09255, partial [Alphaproteobacteria bacterium]